MTRDADVDADVDDVIETLEDIRLETGHGLGRVFRDWMTLSVAAFEGDEDTYHDRLDRYGRDGPSDRRESVAESFSEALGELAVATVEAKRPVVGDIYEAVGNQADDFGQYFTPWNVCIAKAEMLVSADDADEATSDDPLTVADPACGSGRLLVAAAMALHDHDPDAPILVSGTDKDRTCARMAVVNLALANVPGRIQYGNSLTQEIHREWRVTPRGFGPVVKSVEPSTPETDSEASTEAEDVESADIEAGVDERLEQPGLGEWLG
jgi:hypothetical protein